KFGSGERTLNYIGAGQFFGFNEIAHNWRQPQRPVDFQYTLRAIGYTHLLIVPTRVMEEIVLPTLPPAELPALISSTMVSDLDGIPTETAQTESLSKIGADVLEF